MNPLITKLYEKRTLSEAESGQLFDQIFAGEIEPVALAGLLIALKSRGETPDEIAGAAAAMSRAATPFPRPDREIGEIVGTGGDGAQTINVSTTAGLAAAAAGLYIAKHGNSGVSSRSGASDVLTTLGVDIDPSPEESARLLADTGFAFCFAKLYHPAMRFAGPVRAQLGTRTIFNILGPLTSPARPDYALIGVYDPALLVTVAQVLNRQGVKRAFVVHGSGLDEISPLAPTDYAELSPDGSIRQGRFVPADFGITGQYQLSDLRGGDPAVNAAIIGAVLAGDGTPAQVDFVAANLAALLLIGGRAGELTEAARLARDTLASGRGLGVLAAHQAFAKAKAESKLAPTAGAGS